MIERLIANHMCHSKEYNALAVRQVMAYTVDVKRSAGIVQQPIAEQRGNGRIEWLLGLCMDGRNLPAIAHFLVDVVDVKSVEKGVHSV